MLLIKINKYVPKPGAFKTGLVGKTMTSALNTSNSRVLCITGNGDLQVYPAWPHDLLEIQVMAGLRSLRAGTGHTGVGPGTSGLE